MGYTNTTSHYNLPQYVATDKPKYLTDFNQTMEAIDTQMYTNAQAAATADGKAVAAKDTADGAVSSIGTLNTQINGDVSDPSDRGLAGDVSDNSGAINTINSLIGNGTPTTTDQTIIGAINELHAEIGGGSTPSIPASDVTYDNTTSGLTADDVQAAIDEVYAAIPASGDVDADDVSYDNTQSGLAASNVQAAIDEIATATSGRTLRATSTSLTRGTALADLATAFNTLTTMEKANAIITSNDAQIYHICALAGEFNYVTIGTSSIVVNLASLAGSLKNYNGSAVADMSAETVAAGVYKLYA